MDLHYPPFNLIILIEFSDDLYRPIGMSHLRAEVDYNLCYRYNVYQMA